MSNKSDQERAEEKGREQAEAEPEKPPKVDAYGVWNAGSDFLEHFAVGDDAEAEEEHHLVRLLGKHGDVEPDLRVVHIVEVADSEKVSEKVAKRERRAPGGSRSVLQARADRAKK